MGNSLANAQKEKSYIKILALLVCASFFTNMSANMYQSNFALYLTNLEFSSGTISLLVAMFPLSMMTMSLLAGRLSQKFQIKTLLFTAIFAMIITTLGYAITPSLGSGGTAITAVFFFVIRIMHGLANGLLNVVFMTIIAQAVPDTMMARGMGIFSMGTILAQALAPTIGIAISDAFGYQAMFFSALLPLAITLTLSMWIRKIPVVVAKTEKKRFSISNYVETSVLRVGIINFLITCGSATIQWYLVSLASEKGITGASTYFMVNSAVLVLTRVFGGKLLDKIRLKPVVIGASIALCIGLVMISLAPSLWVMLLAAVFCGGALGMVQPCLQAEAVRYVPLERRSIASSTFTVSSALAFTVGSFVSGLIAGKFGYANTFIIMCSPVVVAAVITLFAKTKKPAEVTPAN